MRQVLRPSLVLAALFVVALAVVPGTSAGDPAAVVKGGGSGVLIDPDGNEFPLNSFRVRGAVGDDGSARGRIRFLWRRSFPAFWGDPACGGTCDTIILTGNVESGSVAADGAVTLSGTAREIDKRRGEVVFDSGLDEPFYVVAGGSQGEDRFILQWCLLPEFQIEGSIDVEADDDTGNGDANEDARALTSALSGASCSRGG